MKRLDVNTRARITYHQRMSDPAKREKQRTYARNYKRKKALEDPQGTRDSWLRWKIKSHYGLDWDAYQNLIAEQNGRCAICDDVASGKYRLAIDHDHDTGAIRGLLCGSCNGGMGLFKDNIARLLKAVEYLRKAGSGGESK
jgi:hypothetical protein